MAIKKKRKTTAKKKIKKPAKVSGVKKKALKKPIRAKKRATRKRRKTKTELSLFRLIGKWLLICLIWGFVALFFILVYFAYDLPDTNDIVSIPQKTGITVLAYDDSVIGHYGGIQGDNIRVENIPKHIEHALLATEDRNFYNHLGVDPKGIARAMWQNISAGRFVQGGSTITQQLAKNMFLSADKTLRRKVQEALLSLWLERKLTKSEILSAYLNRVYFGAGAYGIDAGARTYFSKPIYDVSITEAALLVGLLKAPSRYSPFSNPDLTIKRTKTVLHAMNDAGYLSAKEIVDLSAKPIPISISNSSATTQDRYFMDWVVNNIGSFISGAGLDIIVKTTFDPNLQNMAVKEVDILSPESQVAFLAMTKDGAVRAMVGGKNYKKSHFNRTTQAFRQPGSAFKPFVYLAALMQGWRPSDMLLDAKLTGQKYKPKNFANKYYGSVSLNTALEKSLNTATLRLTKEIGIGNVIKTAEKAGINSNLRHDMSLALGSSEVSLLELTSAYTVFANGGYSVYPFAITEIKDIDGHVLYNRELPEVERIFPKKAIRSLDKMLLNAVDNGTGKRANLNGVNVRGKTGTSQNSRDAWFIGYTDKIIAGVWLGNDDNSPMSDIVTGGTVPAGLWRNIMQNMQPLLKSAYRHDSLLQHHNRETKSGITGVMQRLFSRDSNNIKYGDELRYNN